ncbi:MAG: crotonase/enoyl-CoA hydratase family protein [Proteobacteria bacterium]|nr:crotonase/enoyl-CoA hydratase family protein [Pseudomonadota bacterium]
MDTGAQSDYKEIQYEVSEGRARITLSRPEKHNAITALLLEELEAALWEADDDIDVHSVILRGAGPSLCSGYDLSALGRKKQPGHRTGRSHDDDIWLIQKNNRHVRALWEIHKPCIAQVHGNCLAGGTDLAMACDIVIVADDARIGFPAARAMGALPSNLWMYHCGPQWAKRLQLTGDSITGVDAEKIGLAMKSVPRDLLEDEVEGLADRFSHIDPDLLAANKRIVNLSLELMGAQTLQRLAGENDARAHRSNAVREYGRSVKEHGLKETLRRRDEPFGDGMVRVDEPEGRLRRGGTTIVTED